MSQRLRVGIVGTGFGQQVLVPAFRSVADCDVAAICASTLPRARMVANRLEIPCAYGNWRDLVGNPAIDIVAIATPPALQPEIAIAAANSRKHLFCEKPLAINFDEATRMCTAAQQACIAHVVDFEFAELEAWRQAKVTIASGELGTVRHVLVTWEVETYASRLGLDTWKTRTSDGGGVLNSMLSHTLYYLEWLLAPVHSLRASLSPRAGQAEYHGDSVAVLALELNGGTSVGVTASSIAFAGSGHRVEVYGTDGSLVLENVTSDYARGFELRRSLRGGPRDERVSTELLASEPADGRVVAVGRVVQHLVNWIRNGVVAELALERGVRVQELLDAARIAAARTTEVCVQDANA